MNKLLLSAFAFCATAATAQHAVVPAKDRETTSKEEVVATYYLPKSVFEIEVEAVNKKFKAGPFASDAKRLFGTNAETQDRDAWEITNIRIKQKTEPDPAQHYKVFAPYGSNGSLICLTENEILRGVNLGMDFDGKSGKEKPQTIDTQRKHRKEGRKKDARQDKVQKCKENAFKTNFKYKENDSIPEKGDAQFAYELINNLRMTRADMLQQNSDDVNDFSGVIKSIEREERDLYDLFYGKTCKESARKTFTFAPDREGNNQEICKFSVRNGFEETSEAISVSIKKKNSNSRVSNVSGKTGYVYRIPAMAEVEIKQGKTTVWKGTMEIPQLGITESLPVGFFDKNDLKALFDKETGALLQISK